MSALEIFGIIASGVLQGVPEKKNKEKPIPGRGRILVMDDEEMVRIAVGSMLHGLGYEALFARDGEELSQTLRRIFNGRGR
ncbi:MAG TPA: hypothetical protein DCP92_02490 [Nitrospiraceae bacterium]|jgi:PleD family two-component response regulator|nr:hypothetical protein [Nitrospiraceae bacterium]